jgi:single-strand DNA-binding protein
MNKVILMGRLVRDPEIRYGQGENSGVAKYTLAVDRRFKREGDASADYINCVVFGKQVDFVDKYLRQGTKMAVTGRIQTGSYTNKDGVKVYTTDVVVEEQEFAESKSSQSKEEPFVMPKQRSDGFMDIPEGIDDELPFN